MDCNREMTVQGDFLSLLSLLGSMLFYTPGRRFRDTTPTLSTLLGWQCRYTASVSLSFPEMAGVPTTMQRRVISNVGELLPFQGTLIAGLWQHTEFVNRLTPSPPSKKSTCMSFWMDGKNNDIPSNPNKLFPCKSKTKRKQTTKKWS